MSGLRRKVFSDMPDDIQEKVVRTHKIAIDQYSTRLTACTQLLKHLIKVSVQHIGKYIYRFLYIIER